MPPLSRDKWKEAWKTINIYPQTHEMLRQIKQRSGYYNCAIVHKAVERVYREEMLGHVWYRGDYKDERPKGEKMPDDIAELLAESSELDEQAAQSNPLARSTEEVRSVTNADPSKTIDGDPEESLG